MRSFRYLAQDERGRRVRGTMEAADEAELYRRLRQRELLLISCAERSGARPLNDRELSEFFRQLAELTGAGIPLVRAMSIVRQEEGLKPQLRQSYDRLLRGIRQGGGIADAMEQSGAFPALAVSLFRAAEASGTLDETAAQLSGYYERQHRLKSKLRSATVYPRLLCLLTVAAVAFIMAFVMPRFAELFSHLETLPAATRFLMWLSDAVVNEWPLLLAAGLSLSAAGMLALRIPAVRLLRDRLRLSLPLTGGQTRILCTARFARTLASLYSAGMSMLAALQIARKAIGNADIEARFDAVLAEVRGGGSLSDALEGVEGFSRKLTGAVRVGEESGTLDRMLNTIADALEYEAEQSASRMLGYLEPLLIVCMAAVVGFILLAVIVPIYQSYGAMETAASLNF